jgi:hypothetical protein
VSRVGCWFGWIVATARATPNKKSIKTVMRIIKNAKAEVESGKWSLFVGRCYLFVN